MVVRRLLRGEPAPQPGRKPSGAYRSLKTGALAAADVVAALLALAVSWIASDLVRAWAGMESLDPSSTGLALHVVIAAAFTTGLLLWFRSKGHYHRREALSNQLAAILTGTGLCLIGAAALQFVTIEVGSRLLSLSYWILLAGLIVLARILVRAGLRRAGVWASPAVLFVSSARAREIAHIIERRSELGADIRATVAIDGLGAADLARAIRDAEQNGNIAIFAPDGCNLESEAVISRLVVEGVPFILSPRLGPVPDHAEILNYPLEDTAFIEVRDALARPAALAVKRGFDVTVASALLLLLAPVFIVIVLAIRADGGPGLFRQKRVGRGGQAFDCLKLRSMALDAEARLDAMIKTDPEIAAEWKAFQKLSKDPRITPVGRLIRKANLDELPQLLNVIRGDMSLVGPRPMTLSQTGEYGDYLPAYERMRPGITGLWQTNGRNATTFAERARMDAWYVRNWSLWRDFVILIRTVREVLFARGN